MKKIIILSCSFALLGLTMSGHALSFGYGGKGKDPNNDGVFTRDEAQQLAQQHFDRLDKNDDDQVNLAELQGTKENKRTKYDLMLKQVDSNGDEVVTSTEFIAYATDKFDEMDSNKDGTLTEEERQAGKQAYREEVMKIHFEAADINNDGALSWEEFVNIRDRFSHNPRGERNRRWHNHD